MTEPSGNVPVPTWRKRGAPRHDLRDLEAVATLLTTRSEVLRETVASLASLPGIDENRAIRLATADLFVEKAQQVLTRRARRMYIVGTIVTIATVLPLVGGVAFGMHSLSQPSRRLRARLSRYVSCSRLRSADSCTRW
jgi:phage terminase Nu1 subunit (DNA packaging protein)